MSEQQKDSLSPANESKSKPQPKETWSESLLVAIPFVLLYATFGPRGWFYDIDWGSESKPTTQRTEEHEPGITTKPTDRPASTDASRESNERQRANSANQIVGALSADSASMGGTVATMNFFSDYGFKVSRRNDAQTVVVTQQGNGTWHRDGPNIIIDYTQVGVTNSTDSRFTYPPTTSKHRDVFGFLTKDTIRNEDGHVFARIR